MTLIEVMAAGAMLAVGAAGILSGWGSLNNVLIHQRRVVDATSICRSSMESMLILKSDDTRLNGAIVNKGRYDVHMNKLAAGSPEYDAGYDVRHIIKSSTPSLGFVSITVLVTWDENGTSRRIELETFREVEVHDP